MANVTLSNSVYDKLKKTTQLVLPALATLYSGLAIIWNFPAGEEVVGSIALLNTFFGVVLGASSKNYVDNQKDGDIVITRTAEGKKRFSLELDGDPEELGHKQKLVFRAVDEDQAFWDRPFDLDTPTAE